MSEDIQALEQLESLTTRQIEVLDLLIMHRTTKEIARALSIAPNTVDQRISAVRDKWGTTNRKETARRYAQLLEACGKTTYGFSRVDAARQDVDESDRDLPVEPVFILSDASAFGRRPEWDEDKDVGLKGLEAFDAKFGRTGRIVAVFVLALIMAMTLASSLAIADILGRLI
ncbi:helix-turn-helix domain-containing protein [Novosphingobium mangrovi (ex Huang et al. 2023)]|uniref:Helix-turn-helix transcriptional regulator n=1 Tax=Novosphingobium mangrovi (ex Huang et al. 2023) TaxID=2976432 RepID=A0ABT2I2G9_9SPHN|nr:helix-turn-helix transcriptional regulator [Novosphingobium mangrovi (ex Huang et al. 2023)]MCT2398848.1 helix-turn-helix transcriptional regulator [Novosphingobium mangrovi (ex Huang et al. 2023)]